MVRFLFFLPACLLLSCGKNTSPSIDIETKVRAYLDMAYDCMIAYQLDDSKLYIDSAFSYGKNIRNLYLLGYLYNSNAVYYSLILNDSASHGNYYKAMDYYEQAGVTEPLTAIYHNLAFFYHQKNDTEALKRIVDKVLQLAPVQNNNMDLIDTYRIISFYHNELYRKKRQTVYLDSAIYYDRQVVNIFETNPSLPDATRPEEIAYNYINLAHNLLESDSTHLDTISIYIAKAEALAAPNDTAMFLNIYWTKGVTAYKDAAYEKAGQLFKRQLILLEQWARGEPPFMYADIYQKLSEIEEKQKEFLPALTYERKRNEYLNRIHDAQKYEIVRELETKHDVQQKEREVIRLTELNVYRKNINTLYLFISILLIITLFIAIRWFKLKKKAAETQLALARSEKNEAVLQIKFREEQIEKEKLEKYEALLDSHFKNSQIQEMDDELVNLKNEQQQLNTLIDGYVRKLKEYEKRKSQGIAFITTDSFHTGILHDLYELINKRLKNHSERPEYVEMLSTIDDAFFQRLRERADRDELSTLDVKRCVAFLIGMKVSHMAECFSVESRSIHQARHRLKVKLGVERESDLDMFLKQLFLCQ